MERKLFDRIIQVVVKAVTDAMMRICEKYITADELCEQFQMFTPDWLAKYGDVLPRKQVKVTHLDGKTRTTRWGYAQYEIAKNIADGLYDDMKLLR